ncbi:hypothetical protein GQ457_13G016660 [Hibiscus cannabinus]
MNFNSGAFALLFPTLAMHVFVAATRALDALLQDYSYNDFVRHKTGVLYDGVFPSNLIGIQIGAMMLRSGSLRPEGDVQRVPDPHQISRATLCRTPHFGLTKLG